MNIKWITRFILFIAICVMLLIISPKSNLVDIKGTFTSTENPMTMITFDSSKEGNFYYYYLNENHEQVEEEGLFRKLKNGKYEIDSRSLDISECILKDKVLFITIEGKKYKYVKVSDIPSKIVLNSQ